MPLREAPEPAEPVLLEESEVVTRSPLGNQRRDHSELREISFFFVEASFAFSSIARSPEPLFDFVFDSTWGFSGSQIDQVEHGLCCSLMMMYGTRTGNDGLLGSRLDEGRREMRYALRIAGSRESFDFPTHMRPRRKSRARRPQVFTPRSRLQPLNAPRARRCVHRRRWIALFIQQPNRSWSRDDDDGLLRRTPSTRASILRPTRKPAEVKHINKRRKRNQQGCP